MPISPYASSEDVAVVCPGDFVRICPLSSIKASAADGSVGSAWADRWLLTSPSSNFVVQGVAAGHVMHLARSGATLRQDLRPEQGSVFVVGSVLSATQLRFRPLRQAQGQGNPPRAASASGIVFEVLSADPWIEEASAWLDGELRSIPGISDEVPPDIFPDEHYRRVTAIKATAELYLISARNAATISDADQTKADAYLKQVADRLDRVRADYEATNYVPAIGSGAVLEAGTILLAAEDDESEWG